MSYMKSLLSKIWFNQFKRFLHYLIVFIYFFTEYIKRQIILKILIFSISKTQILSLICRKSKLIHKHSCMQSKLLTLENNSPIVFIQNSFFQALFHYFHPIFPYP